MLFHMSSVTGALLLATIAAASQAIQGIKPHAQLGVVPSVVVPGEYQYAEKQQAIRVKSSGQQETEVIMDSSATAVKSSAGLMRRQDSHDHASLLEAEHEPKRDLYVKVGDNLCDGGGLWKRYEVNSVTPGKYGYCASVCDGKDECIGFDVGTTGCNMYTQKAVALGSWPYVSFSNGDSFVGDGDHDSYPAVPTDLVVGASSFGTTNKFQCFRKFYYRPVESYYRTIGIGTCSGGGQWKRYPIPGGSEAMCQNACSLRDECMGFDAGEGECHLYTQKAMFGLWPGVDATTALDGVGDHDAFPPTPYSLTVPADAHNSTDTCYGKTNWISLASYYMKLGDQTCTGGGTWKHYKIVGGTADACKDSCDSKVECVGLDITDAECRLYTSAAVPGWSGVTDDGGNAFAGSGEHDRFTPTAFSLSPDTAATVNGTSCLAKTHDQT